MLYEFSCDTARQCVNFQAIVPGDHPIILELFLILFTNYYSKNYSSLMYTCLLMIELSVFYIIAELIVEILFVLFSINGFFF